MSAKKRYKMMSVKDYADSFTPKKHRQTILAQIWEERLPEGVRAEKVGNTYVIYVPEESSAVAA
jgi:hypothetical protein